MATTTEFEEQIEEVITSTAECFLMVARVYGTGQLSLVAMRELVDLWVKTNDIRARDEIADDLPPGSVKKVDPIIEKLRFQWWLVTLARRNT